MTQSQSTQQQERSHQQPKIKQKTYVEGSYNMDWSTMLDLNFFFFFYIVFIFRQTSVITVYNEPKITILLKPSKGFGLIWLFLALHQLRQIFSASNFLRIRYNKIKILKAFYKMSVKLNKSKIFP